MMQATPKNLGALAIDMADILRPPERLSVSQAATKYRYLNNPGSYVGPWTNDMTPYLVDVMDALADRQYNAVILVGPAQSGKTDAGVNWLVYTVICDPMDMIIFQTTNTSARDFSKRRIDRLHRHSPAVGARLLPSGTADNVGQKIYRSGVMLSISWPSISEMSGRPVGSTWLTDLDRMPNDVGGEGSPFDLARARTRTFGANGTTFAESSPGYEVKDPKWIRQSPHEAPPCEGILALYNRGDRRRWYWKCPHCASWFEPSFELLKWIDSPDVGVSAESAKMMCPHCTALIEQTERYKLNIAGKWLADNQTIDKNDVITGEAQRTGIASFWLKGPAATFSSWADLVQKYLLAEQEWLRTGSQEALKSTINIDQGEPFYPRGSERERVPDELKAMAVSVPEKEVPNDVRFLIATADVQKNQWVVQVFGIAPATDAPFRAHVIDRFDIRKSARKDADGDTLWVKPGSHLEDWDLVTEQVLGARYPMADGSGTLGIAYMGCDSGGRAGVTAKAYEWYRKLRQFGDGIHQRVHLIKGEGRPDAPRARVGYPDAAKKDKKAVARGDVPVLFLNVNALKDELNNMLDRPGEDGGQFVYPDWLPDEWFKEMCSERRTAKGWENPQHSRNEAWDLATYLLGICRHRKVDRMNWDDAPDWATPIVAENCTNTYFLPKNVSSDSLIAKGKSGGYNSIAELAEKLA